MIHDPLQYLRAIADASKDSNGSSSVTWAHVLLVSLKVAMEKSVYGKEPLLCALHDGLDGALRTNQQASRLPSLSDDDLVEAVRELADYDAERPSLVEPQDRLLRWLSDRPAANLDDWTKSTWRQLLNENRIEAAHFEGRQAWSTYVSDDDAAKKKGGKMNPPSDSRSKSSVRLQHWLPTIVVVAGFFTASIAFTWQNGKQVTESLERKIDDEVLARVGALVEIPVGGITIFFGNENELPGNWKIANGQRVNDPESRYHGKQLPDLRNRFIRGAYAVNNVGHEGGRNYVPSHFHSVNVNSWPSGSLPCLVSGQDLTAEIPDNWDGTCSNAWSKIPTLGGEYYHSAVITRNWGEHDLYALVREGSDKAGIRFTEVVDQQINMPRYTLMHYIIRIK